jgi:cell wall-associated NlpC family hydrolase
MSVEHALKCPSPERASRHRYEVARPALLVAAAALPFGSAVPAQAAPSTPLDMTPSASKTAPSVIQPPTAPTAGSLLLPTVRVTRYVDVGVANVRSGPSTGYRVVTQMRRGQRVSGTRLSNGWIRMSGGRYISGTVVSGSSTSRSTTSSTTSRGGVTRYVTASLGNVRSGSGLNHRVVGTLSRGTRVTGSVTSNGWLRLSSGRYVSSAILSRSSSATAASRSSTRSASGSAVIAEARRHLGTMYVWGGASPTGFDCSGFVQYVFARVGVSLPRVVADQKAVARPVSSPQVGDLVFWGTWHVAIYAGNGYIYDSGRPGLPVQKRRMFSGVTGYGRVG